MLESNAAPQLPANVFRVPTDRLDEVKAHFAKATKRAAKLGCAAPSYTIGESVFETVKRNGRQVMLKYTYITLNMNTTISIVAGWEFVAQLEHMKAGDIVRSFVENLPASYRSCDANCDHCNIFRNRINTYILRNVASGEFKQVGSTCLEAFTGIDCGTLIAQMEFALFFPEELSDMFGDDGEGGTTGGTNYINLAEYLSYVAELITTCGWFPKSGSDSPTCYAALSHMNGDIKDPVVPSEESVAIAKAAIEWAKSNEGDNDYLSNLRVIASEEGIKLRGVGFAASIVSSFLRSEAKRKERASTVPSEWQGTVGERTHFVLTVGKVISFETQYGTTHVHIMRDDNSNVFVWKASGTYLGDPGKSVILKATIKAHETYEKTGVRQTILTRATELDSIPVVKVPRTRKRVSA